MKTFTHNKLSKAVQAALVVGIAVTGSVSAMAAVPEVPMIDWLEASIVEADTSDFIEVDTGWSRYDLEDVYSVQYRVDGKPVNSVALEPGQRSGDAIVHLSVDIDNDQEIDFTIALCNADGCGETNPFIISVTDGFEVEVTAGDAPVSNVTAPSQVFGASPAAAPATMLGAVNPAGAILGQPLATELAKAALGGLFSGATNASFQKVMSALGLGALATADQVAQLQSSVTDMSGDIADITKELEKLGDQSEWHGFVEMHKTANVFVTQIHGAFEDLSNDVAQGIYPPDYVLTSKYSALDDGMTALTGAVGTAGNGLLDMRDGAIYQLMEAVPQRVSSVESYWLIIEQYREYYRTALALGYLALDLFADNFDDTGAVRVTAERVFETAQTTTLNMYAYGIAPEMPTSDTETLDFVQIRGQLRAVADEEYAVLDESAVLKKSDNSYIVGWLSNAAAQYQPEHHDGMTFEEFLVESNVPTAYYMDSTVGFESSGWYLRVVEPGSVELETAPLVGVFPRVVRIEGNDFVDDAAPFCELNPEMCEGGSDTRRMSYDPDIPLLPADLAWVRSKIDSRKANAWANGGFVFDSSTANTPVTFAAGYYSSIDLTGRVNHAGRMAELDEDLVSMAAFGDRAATIGAGSLPGSDGGECIGLPDEPTHLMDVEDYFLLWQPDGNLTLRDADNQLKWVSRTHNNADQLCWHADGNFAIYNGSDVTFESDTSDAAVGGYGGRFLKLHRNGALQIVNELDDVLWWEGTME